MRDGASRAGSLTDVVCAQVELGARSPLFYKKVTVHKEKKKTHSGKKTHTQVLL
jgi:hypothetical protein